MKRNGSALSENVGFCDHRGPGTVTLCLTNTVLVGNGAFINLTNLSQNVAGREGGFGCDVCGDEECRIPRIGVCLAAVFCTRKSGISRPIPVCRFKFRMPNFECQTKAIWNCNSKF